MTVNKHIFNHLEWSSFIQLFETQAARYHDRTFIHYQASDTMLELKTLSYGQLNCIGNYLANQWLPQLDGVQCVAFLGGNPLQSILTMAAISKLGKTFFPLSTGNSVEANAHLLSKANVQCLIASEEYGRMAHESTTEQKRVHVNVWRNFDLEKLITLAASDSGTLSRNQPKLSDITLILHSSGTTGLPKPILLSNQWVIRLLAILPRKIKPNGERLMDDAETIMTTFSAFHMGGVWMYWLPITVGGSVVVLGREPPSTADFLEVIRKRMVTGALVAPVHLENLAKLLRTKGIDRVTSDGLKKFKFCAYGGAPLSDEMGDFLKSSGLNIGNGFGSTELNNVALASFLSDDKNYQLITPNEFASGYIKWVPYDDNGLCHLLIRGDSPSLSATAIASIGDSGYYETNDLFQEYPPNSGYWRYVMRIDDILVLSDGGKTDPLSLENEIRNANVVKHCVVVGHGKSNTAVLIELNLDRANKRQLTEVTSEVYRAVRGANKAAAQKHSHIVVPDMVYILPPNRQLPTTPKGSIARKKVLQQFEKEIQKMYDDYLGSSKSVPSGTSGNSGVRPITPNYLQSKL